MSTRPKGERSPFADFRSRYVANGPDENHRRQSGIAWGSGVPVQELGIVIWVNIPQFGFGCRMKVQVLDVRMEKAASEPFGGLVRVNVQGGRLQKGKQQRPVRQDGT